MHATWILADAHGGADPTADRGLLDLLDAARARGVDLLILGDLFVAWLGPERFHTPFQREVLARIRALRATGRKVELVAGNRDFLVRDLAGSTFDRVLEGEVVVQLAGRPVLVAHGDGLDPTDLTYLAWRALARSRPITRALSILPGRLGRRLAEATERRLRGTNRTYKTGAVPRPALEALGRRARGRGAERALIGHFHSPMTLEVTGGAPVTIAPAWLEERRVLAADPARPILEALDPLGALVR